MENHHFPMVFLRFSYGMLSDDRTTARIRSAARRRLCPLWMSSWRLCRCRRIWIESWSTADVDRAHLLFQEVTMYICKYVYVYMCICIYIP